MDFKLFTESLQRDLKEIHLNNSNKIKRANRAIRLCHTLLTLYKKKISVDGFESVENEIDFFKNVKTIPSSQLIYYNHIRSFELQFPKGNVEAQRKFIKKRLNRINGFYIQHIDFGEYIELGHTHFDEQYFTRKYLESLPIVSASIYFHDPEFSTPKDLLLAEFKGFNLFVNYLQNRLIDKSKSFDENQSDSSNHIKLQWSSTKVALTELIYALHYNKVLNNGNADIKEIAMAMQQIFHFDLGDFYKIFFEIKSRKISRTKFLDDLASGLQSHMDSTEE
ncbi:RteC domain-containing protein [uncultured Croceitalea sp.]|uniref:RteC domain-containing protein n=1 Tax=uncultured Croceitalea sp. TaxID=1798908 RepID=UPI00374F4749